MRKKIDIVCCGILIPALCLGFAACEKEENVKASATRPEKKVSSIFQNNSNPRVIKLFKDTVYVLDRDLMRDAGEQLIIEEGTLIKAGIRDIANPGINNPSQGSITIRPGGVIVANGTIDEPIIFTSNMPAGAQATNWGGISLEGKSTDNNKAVTTDPADFSGSLRYCRIEFAPLTLRAVGNRTLLENIMVSYANRNGSAAYNIYGGTFNAKYLISFACGGPADFYIANGYNGKMQYVLAYRHPFFGNTGSVPVNALTGLFIENNANNPVNARPYTYPVISNMTVIGPNGQHGSVALYSSINTRTAALVTTKSAGFNIRNSLFLGFPKGGWILDDSLTANAIETGIDVLSNSMFQTNDTSRAFYLLPGSYPPFISGNFKNFMLRPILKTTLYNNVDAFGFKDLFNYNNPALLPNDNSIVLTGASFDDGFSNSFFNKVDHLGAFGKTDWLMKWTNFVPLKTNYNFPE
jgi:hypothetical protein